jgi:hypothetical protein
MHESGNMARSVIAIRPISVPQTLRIGQKTRVEIRRANQNAYVTAVRSGSAFQWFKLGLDAVAGDRGGVSEAIFTAVQSIRRSVKIMPANVPVRKVPFRARVAPAVSAPKQDITMASLVETSLGAASRDLDRAMTFIHQLESDLSGIPDGERAVLHLRARIEGLLRQVDEASLAMEEIAAVASQTRAAGDGASGIERLAC